MTEIQVQANEFDSRDDEIAVAVCGQHMKGGKLHFQLEELKATYVGVAETAPTYRLFILPTDPVKPGLLRSGNADLCGSVELEIYRLSTAAFGRFVSMIPAPLSFGKIELTDHSRVEGFLVEASAVFSSDGRLQESVREITDLGSFSSFL